MYVMYATLTVCGNTMRSRLFPTTQSANEWDICGNARAVGGEGIAKMFCEKALFGTDTDFGAYEEGGQ